MTERRDGQSKLVYDKEKRTIVTIRNPPCEVTDSCGCVYCDLGLDPDIEIEGVKFHHAPRRGNILCERRRADAPANS